MMRGFFFCFFFLTFFSPLSTLIGPPCICNEATYANQQSKKRYKSLILSSSNASPPPSAEPIEIGPSDTRDESPYAKR